MIADTHFFDSKTLLVGTHRGISLTEPVTPNTLTALYHPDNQPAQFIEVDCVLTHDHCVVLNHDPVCGNHPIATHTYAQLKVLHPHLITLDTLCNAESHTRQPKGLYLELKPYAQTDDAKHQLVAAVHAVLDTYHLNNYALIVSFDATLLAISHTLNPTIPTGLNLAPPNTPLAPLTEAALANPILAHVDYLCPHCDVYDQASHWEQPRLLWEYAGETAIYDRLERLPTRIDRHDWCAMHRIHGFCTNTVVDTLGLIQ